MMSPWTTGNRLQMLKSGEEYFPSVFNAIALAKKRVQIEIYTLEMDKTGQEFIDHLGNASDRGLEVQLLIDGFGSAALSQDDRQKIISKGISLKVFRPFFWNRAFSFFFRRLHRKNIVIDENLAFVGGFNIADDYFFHHPKSGKYDVALKVEGPAAQIVSKHMDLLWRSLERHWKRVLKLRTSLISQTLASRHTLRGSERIKYRIRDGWLAPRSIEHSYREAIRAAHKKICIAQAYFFPPFRLLRALIRASRRGVKVQLLLQGKSDVLIIKLAEWMLYEKLIRAGIEIFEFREKHLHAKAAVIDTKWMTVGSSNLDPWSLRINLEGNLIIENSPICQELEEEFNRVTQNQANRISLDEVKKMSLSQRTLGRVAFWFLSLWP